jgi:hypothetical protein
MHEAAGEGAFEGAQLAIVEAGHDDFHLKFAEVERSRGRLRADTDLESLSGELARAEVLHYSRLAGSLEAGIRW